MKLGAFLTIKAVISFIFGTAALLAPAQLVSMYGVALDPFGVVMSRLLGAVLLGIGFICWFTRIAAYSDLRQGILLSLFIGDTLGFIVDLLTQLSGVENALGWMNVAVWFFLALGLGYFRFIKTE